MTASKDISCIIIDDEAIAREVIATHVAKIPKITIVKHCRNAIEAFNALREHKVDLIFLDINMPEISGISFAKSINTDVKIIFTTAYRDYAVEGFELQAVDYLLKPISFDRLLKAVNNYFDIYTQASSMEQTQTVNNNFMFVRADRRMIKIDFESIIYIESYSDYIKIHLANKTIVTRETISAIEAKLPNAHFLRIHRSYIIALKHIESFTNEEITINNIALTISRSYKKDVLKILEKF
ncbi:response regulator transcription factor [Algibacter amylolyticus]|uniref:Response regulator transcription factor n=1 Tax=Algibacter amylolyticus TaxID=1608400 RepID=A0A5M7B4F9_9FLAO|nr:LytTR family DNA-binding domain-containing protein [Algibacter amylolyticus]KAA5822364.1 response regulator transcription factor [Algibacter amylolyticus]MBB5269082.1 DNA-binding LytR/AlgR family response regulator [Algibacter amylolyticus]TSJ73514.1 response regulator transcription factor [Algibacter amylolyticus]